MITAILGVIQAELLGGVLRDMAGATLGREYTQRRNGRAGY